MTDAEVLYLHGSPGAGKTTLSQELAALLSAAGTASAVIDMDELSLVFPHSDRHAFARWNLRAIWPNYAAIPGVRVLIAGVVADEEERELLRAAVASAPFTVCELTAPKRVLQARVTARASAEDAQKDLRNWIDIYHRRTDLVKVRDFAVSTYNRSVTESAHEVIATLGW